MDRLRRPPTAGIVASALTALAVLVPYALPALDAGAVGTYYDAGLMGGWSVLTVALVALVAFASGRQGRTDPDTAAGAVLVLGLVATLLAAFWALAVPYDVVVQLQTGAWFEYHRWVVLASAAAIAVCGGWYAYALEIF